MKLYNINSTKIEGREYTIKDVERIEGIAKLKQKGLDGNFYGGRLTAFGKCKDNDNLILLIELKNDKFTVVDIAVENPENLPKTILKELARKKKKKFASSASIEDLANLIK